MTPDGADGHWVKDESGVWALVAPSLAWIEQAATADTPPEPTAPAEITLADVAAALRDPLANLTPSSASTTVRTAILNQRAALDALLAALETP